MNLERRALAAYDAPKFRDSENTPTPQRYFSIGNFIIMPFFAATPLSAWIGFGVSLAVCGLIVLTKALHGSFTFDTEVGPQKFHEKATPRIGGAALLLGFWAAALFTPPPTRQYLSGD